MKAKTIILLSALAAVPAAGIAYYGYAMANYKIELHKVSFASITEGNIYVNVEFLITNTTGIKFTIFDTAFDFYINGSKVGIAKQPVPVDILSGWVTNMVVTVIIDKTVLGSSIFDFILSKITGSNTGVQVVAQGVAKLRLNAPVLSMFTVNIPVNESYNL